jgi:hypothetical protein
MGGCLGISMATHRNGSAAILRRIGGTPLEWDGQPLPAYYDAHYKCEMEMIRFDSRVPAEKYRQPVEIIHSQIANMPVVCADKSSNAWDSFVNRWQNSTPAFGPWNSENVVPIVS